MKKLFFTITGCSFRYGLDFFKPGMVISLIKEPDNRFDREAIRVELDGLGTVGYVANSPNTVRGTSMSAGRLYDKIPARIEASVQYVLSDSVVACVESPDVPETENIPDFTEYTADIDIYSNEDLSYLQPIEEDTEADADEELPVNADDEFPVTGQPAIGEGDDTENTVMPQEEEEPSLSAPSLNETVSAEDIASALKAALSGLTGGSAEVPEEDPDADYIYGNKSGVTISDPSPSEEAAEDAESPASSFGLTAADIAGILASGSFGKASNQAGTEKQTDEALAVSESPSEAEPDEEDTAPSVAYIDADDSSDSPGLNFNNARFPEEVEEDVRPASVKNTIMDKEPEVDEDLPSPAGEDGTLPESGEELLQADNTEDQQEAVIAEAISVEETADPPAAGQQTDEEAGESPEADVDTGEGPEPEAADAKTDAPSSSDGEEYDFSQDRFQFDESELDDNLAQLHLEDIDATYLPENFLENLKKRLRESNH